MVSGTAYEQLHGKLDLALDFAGEQRVKNVARPVRAYHVRLDGVRRGRRPSARQLARYAAVATVLLLAAAAVVGWWLWLRTPAGTGRPSIAVLPFDNYGGDEATGRLGGGMSA